MVDDLCGRTIGGFEIVRRFSRPPLGTLYESRETATSRPAALKFYPESVTQNPILLERIGAGVAAAARVRHPNLAAVYRPGFDSGRHFVAMEIVQGADLGSIVVKRGQLPMPSALSIFRQIADALSAAHANGFVHRHIKPQNIIINDIGRVKVIGLGLAVLSESEYAEQTGGAQRNWPAYISPEQCRGGEVDARSDVFSLGATVYYMLAGRVPFSGSNPGELMDAIVRDRHRPLSDSNPNVPEAIEWIVDLALAKNPRDRFENAGEVAAAIDEAMGVTAARRAIIADKETIKPQPEPELNTETADPVEKEVAPRIGGIKWAAVLVLLIAIGGTAFYAYGRKGPKNSAMAPASIQQAAASEFAGELKLGVVDASMAEVSAIESAPINSAGAAIPGAASLVETASSSQRGGASECGLPLEDITAARAADDTIANELNEFANALPAKTELTSDLASPAPLDSGQEVASTITETADSTTGALTENDGGQTGGRAIATDQPSAGNEDAAETVSDNPIASPNLVSYIENELNLDLLMIRVPAGSFTMGSEIGEDAKPHRVELRGFWISQTEINQDQWRKLMGNNPSEFTDSGRMPVENVSWDDAVEFCCVLSANTERQYALPTEAEWEYACRAGTATAYSFGESRDALPLYGWFQGNSEGKPHPTGRLRPNPWGIHDMHGNLWEWCADWYSEAAYEEHEVRNPTGPATGFARVVRGGSWYHLPVNSRSDRRFYARPDSRNRYIGFRIVRRGESADSGQ